jgi:glycosyltransferase involved in cell wall biosynthesis
MWSRRGFPVALPLLLQVLKLRGCRTAVIFHDVYAVAGSSWIDRFRVAFQERIMRHVSARAGRAILPVPLERVPWLSNLKSTTVFIPVGANVPSLEDLTRDGFVAVPNAISTVAVFGVPTWPAAQRREVHAIVESLRQASAKIGELQLLVLGRGSREAEPLLRAGLSGTGVRLRVDGLRSGQEISAGLSSSQVLLFVRGALSSRRGSGIAGIACGLPIVAYEGRETGPPLTEAGVVFVPQDDVACLGDQLASLLPDRERRMALSARNLAVFREWFSWDRIADRWIEALGSENKGFRT